jgi:hypothetical protein
MDYGVTIGTDNPLSQQLAIIIQTNLPDSNTLKCLQLMLKLYQNLLTDIYNEKFRTINLSNQNIRDKIIAFNGTAEFFFLSGFQPIEIQN